MNWKECGGKRTWPNSRYYTGICLKGLRTTTNILSQDSRSPGQNSNAGPTDYKAAVSSTRPAMTFSRTLPYWYYSEPHEVTSHRKSHRLTCNSYIMTTICLATFFFMFNKGWIFLKYVNYDINLLNSLNCVTIQSQNVTWPSLRTADSGKFVNVGLYWRSVCSYHV
jgi:hypothetical protein